MMSGRLFAQREGWKRLKEDEKKSSGGEMRVQNEGVSTAASHSTGNACLSEPERRRDDAVITGVFLAHFQFSAAQR